MIIIISLIAVLLIYLFLRKRKVRNEFRILITGQSNSIGQQTESHPRIICSGDGLAEWNCDNPHSLIMGYENGSLRPFRIDKKIGDKAEKCQCTAFHFARRVAHETGKNVSIVVSGQGGSSINKWDPIKDNNLFKRSVFSFKKCFGKQKANLIIWIQGEKDHSELILPTTRPTVINGKNRVLDNIKQTDIDKASQEYKAKLKNIISSYVNEIGNPVDTKIILVESLDKDDTNKKNIENVWGDQRPFFNKAKMELAQELPNVGLAKASDLPHAGMEILSGLGDASTIDNGRKNKRPVHFHSVTHRYLGYSRMWQVYKDLTK